MKLAKRLGYKLIIVLCIIATFCSFIASTPVHASKVNTSDFYYSGTSKGSYTVSKGLIDTIIESLGAILDYLLGIMTMGFRMVFVGWTALFERCLTLIIQGLSGDDVEVDGVSATGLFSADGWITLDAIFFNHVPLLDINFFRFETIEGYDNLGFELENAEGEPVQGAETPQNSPRVIYTEEIQNESGEVGTVQVSAVQGRTNNLNDDPPTTEENKKSLIIVFKEAIAGWYYTIRLISIMVMLIFLIYIGIQMAIKSTATDKAVYKKMLADWVVGMLLIFCIHYIMLFIITFNEVLVDQISKLRTGATPLAVYEYGLKEKAQKPIENDELELTLYDEVKTRAYDLKMTVGTTGMIMYMVLVYYAWKFTFIYLKRYLTVAVLVIMAPLIAATYAYNKVRSGKAQIFSRWLKEFAFIVLLQSIHALMYVTFMQTALALSLGSISSFILVLLLLNFMCKAEGIFRKIFGIGNQGAGLLNDITNGPGLRDTLKAATNIMAAKEIKNLAVGYTKGVASAMTKPARMAGEVAFKGHMVKKAEQLNQMAKDYAQETGNSSIKNYSDYKKYMRNRRTQANEIGSMLTQLESGELNIESMQKYVDSLQEGEDITDINGNITGVVTAEYKAEMQAKGDKLKAIANMSDKEKDAWRADYNKLYNKKGQLKGLSIYLSEKWEDIFDPSVYTEAVTNEKGEVVSYQAIKTERQGFRKLDSVGKRLSKRLKLKNIANISKEEKKHLEEQVEHVKNAIGGFAGILTGIPLLVAEPSAGMVAMSYGIGHSSKLLSGKGRSYQRGISGYSIDRNGNYSFNRFEGTSTRTIARGAKKMAEEQVAEITRDHMNHDINVRKRVEKNHPKLAERLKKAARDNSAALGTGAATVAGFSVLGAPPVAIAAGAIAGARFTGRALRNSRMMDNAWARYNESMRVINKANRKAYEKRLEKGHMDDYMDVLAERYFEIEKDEFHSDAVRHAEEFESEYKAAVLAMEMAIEEKSSQELLRDSGYDVSLDGEVEGHDETLKISQTAENQLIEKALVTYAVQTGTMDISKIVVDDKMDRIETILKTDLMTRGLVTQGTDIKDVIQNLDSKVKDAQVKIVKDKRNESAVEDRLAGDAIVSLMQEQGITDPTKISNDQAMQKFAEMYQTKTAESIKSSTQTNDVLSQLNAQKPEQTEDVPKAFDIDRMKKRATTAIQARKASFSDMAKKSIDDSVAAQLRETIKKKQKLELDTQILDHEAKLNKQKKTESTGISELFSNQNGGVDSSADGSSAFQPSGAEDIIKMLQLQTQLHQDKKKMQLVDAKTREQKKERAALYQEISASRAEASSDGSRRVDRVADGSRQVGRATGGSQRGRGVQREAPPVALNVTEIIENLKRQ